MEDTFEVKPIGIKYMCDGCNIGEMNYTNVMEIENSEPVFTHRCINCGSEEKLAKKYPTIDFLKI